MSFLHIQTQTGWGQVLESFAEWCRVEQGWLVLDIGCGPGLLPALLAECGCQAIGIDLDAKMLASPRLHVNLAQADALHLPFPGKSFHLVTASNLLFLLPTPVSILLEIRRVLRRHGQVALLNPSEHMSVAAATALAERRGLEGLARDSLLNWAGRAETNHRWSETDLQALFTSAGLRLTETTLKVGPGLARLARAELKSDEDPHSLSQ